MTEFPETRMSLLVQLQARENREAWEEFVEIYRPLVYRMARRRGMQDADAQDVTQVILTRVAGAIENYEPQPGIRFRHWLRRVARNAILTALSRQHGVLGAGDTDTQHLLNQQVDATVDFEQELTEEFQRELFLRAAACVRTEVNSETWRAFELTVVEGLSCEAASLAIGKSIGTVYAGRSRVMKRLRDQIERMQRDES